MTQDIPNKESVITPACQEWLDACQMIAEGIQKAAEHHGEKNMLQALTFNVYSLCSSCGDGDKESKKLVEEFIGNVRKCNEQCKTHIGFKQDRWKKE